MVKLIPFIWRKLFFSILYVRSESGTNLVLVHWQFPCLVTTADIGFGAGRIILDGDEAVSQLIRAPFVLFSLSFALFQLLQPPQEKRCPNKSNGRETVSERLHCRTILGSWECPIQHWMCDAKLPSIQRQSYHPIKTLALGERGSGLHV